MAAEQVSEIAIEKAKVLEGREGSGAVFKVRAEAQAAFTAAGHQVAQTLWANNPALAARLQEVVKQVERNPYLGGLNRENVGKAIAAADRLEKRGDGDPLGELKHAAAVLEQVPQQVSRNPTAMAVNEKSEELER